LLCGGKEFPCALLPHSLDFSSMLIGFLKGEPTAQTHIIKQSHYQLPNVRPARQQTKSHPWRLGRLICLTRERKYHSFQSGRGLLHFSRFSAHRTPNQECPAPFSNARNLYTNRAQVNRKICFSKIFFVLKTPAIEQKTAFF
jgi:hypothetical protein